MEGKPPPPPPPAPPPLLPNPPAAPGNENPAPGAAGVEGAEVVCGNPPKPLPPPPNIDLFQKKSDRFDSIKPVRSNPIIN